MQLNAVQRVAAVVLTAVLLFAAGQEAAIAGDPQWEKWDAPPPAAQP